MKILDIDIETAPNLVLTWGLFNQNIGIDNIMNEGYTLCWAARWRGTKKVMFSSILDGEKKMIKEVHKLLDEADVVVHYNGAKFDMPILNKEFIKQGLHPPTPYQQVDLLQAVRRRFKFVSNKLDFVARFLGIGSKQQHKGIKLWIECMEKDKKAWKLMERYNKQDVILLELLYDKLLPWIQDHPNHALFTDEEKIICTNCGSDHVVKNGVERLSTMSYQRYRCQDCGTPIRDRGNNLPLSKRKTILTQSKL